MRVPPVQGLQKPGSHRRRQSVSGPAGGTERFTYRHPDSTAGQLSSGPILLCCLVPHPPDRVTELCGKVMVTWSRPGPVQPPSAVPAMLAARGFLHT